MTTINTTEALDSLSLILDAELLPALARMTTKPETESHQHGPADIEGHTGI